MPDFTESYMKWSLNDYQIIASAQESAWNQNK